jgi:hypothetical protein
LKASLKWRIDQGQRTISPMVNRKEWRKAIAISLLVSVITLVPYIIASFQVDQGGVFSGFLINPKDGFSYLAKMREGVESQWLFYLPYSIEPGKGTFIFIFFLFLGHLSRWFGIPPIVLYHAVRFLGSITMFSTAFVLVAKFIKNKTHRWWAFSLILIGGGFGWLAIPFGLLPSDLWIVESIPFLTAYANAHFPLAATLFLLLIIFMISVIKPIGVWMGAAFLVSTLLATIQPFSMIPLFVFLFIWLIWETWIQVKGQNVGEIKIREKWLVYLAIILGAIPWFAYDFWITLTHPEIGAWNAQNITPSPPIVEYIFGFGGVLLIATIGLLRGHFKDTRAGRMLMVWGIVQAILLYAPFGLQRRLSMGLYFSLVILAVMTLERLIQNKSRLRFTFMTLLLLSIPSNLVVVGSGIAGVMQIDPMVVLDQSEVEAYQWLSSNAEPGEIVLAGPIAGNRIPAYANLKVFYGHPFETVNAEEQMAFIEQAYTSEDGIDRTYEKLRELGVSYVFYGPEEKELGLPVWLEKCKLDFNSGEYSIYEIPRP